jgi:hypothetical protein
LTNAPLSSVLNLRAISTASSMLTRSGTSGKVRSSAAATCSTQRSTSATRSHDQFASAASMRSRMSSRRTSIASSNRAA